MKKTILGTIGISILTLIASCGTQQQNSKTAATVLVPGYEEDILPLLTSRPGINCTLCHSQQGSSNQLMGSWFYTYESLTNNTNATLNVKRLVGAITHQPGFKPMPRAGANLTADQMALVKKWADNGAPKNRVLEPVTPVEPPVTPVEPPVTPVEPPVVPVIVAPAGQ